MPKLTYVVGSGGETRSVDVGDSCSIGSLAGNTIVLDASMGVSRRHCQILKIATGYELSDLGSTNGTKVNGQTVKRAKVSGGDKIEVGKVVMTFDDGSGAVAGGAEEEISLEETAAPSAPSSGPSARSGGAASDQCVLVFAGGEKDGQKIPLDKPRVTFGRNPKNVVQLNDNGASGFHAEIAREGGAYVLRDLGSTNGTLVDGEPVSETALQHGARIRMGNTRFVFVDPTVSDFEKAMAAVDDLGSEWGMLRAEMDMTRVQKARRSQMVTTLVLLAVVLGGGAFVWVNRDKITGRKADLNPIAGNKVGDFSFEDRGGADWAARPGTPTKARPADAKSDGPAKQGTAFYAVTRDGPGGACAAAQSPADSLFTVTPGQAAEFGASVRAGSGAMGGVRIVWLDKPDAAAREIGRNASSLSSASEWQEVKGAAMPPEGARAARLELINAASGTAYFDDVFLVWGGSAGGGSAKDGPTTVTASADAQTTISRGDVKLLVNGAVVGGALKADAVDNPSLHGDRAGSQTMDKGGLDASGRFVDPATNQTESFKVDVSANGGRFVEIKGSWKGADAAWVAQLPDEFFAAGIGVKTESDFRRATEPHVFEKVEDVSFGGQHRFKVTKGEKGGALRMALYRVGDQWEVGFGAADGNLSIKIDSDSDALTQQVTQLKQEAESARQHREFGTAILKFSQLEAEYPSNSNDAQQAKDERTRIEDSGKDRLAKLSAKVAGAIQFHDAKELAAAKDEAETLKKEYGEHPIAKSAAEKIKAIDDAVAADRLAADERLAAPLLKKADDFRDHKDGENHPAPWSNLAKAYYNEIVQRYPNTEAAKKAREALGKL